MPSVRHLLPGLSGILCLLAAMGVEAAQDEHHAHQALGPSSGVMHGVPRLCAAAEVVALHDGNWSDDRVWSTGRKPQAGERVLVSSGISVTYDTVSDVALKCVDIEGKLAFRTDRATRLKVGTLTVLPRGELQIGTSLRPVQPDRVAEIVIADDPIDTKLDPEQFGTGLIGLGKITIHGATRLPAFARTSREPQAGTLRLEFDRDVTGWQAGDKLVIPDTRQLKRIQSREQYVPQWEELKVATASARSVTLSAPLVYDHRGARTPSGELEFLPHVGNLTRNVVLRSENEAGTRGHVIFVGRADVDIRYALFKGLGRTRLGVLDNVQYSSNGTVTHVGTNQIGRYSLHFHHAFGPVRTPANGYQFTLVGNAVDDASKWGITIHNSHYGLVEDNVVYDSRGAGIVTEDGSESFNVFSGNFVLRSQGTGEFAPASGYGGNSTDPGGEGAGFWMRGPNNFVRNNVAANVEVFGFGIAAGALVGVQLPRFKGADTSLPKESASVDSTSMSVLEFTGNEAYGAIQTGVAIGWNGTLSNTRIWHTTRQAVTALPADSLTLDGFTIRGDPSVLEDEWESPAGIWFSNYAAKSVRIRNADVQGMRVGVVSPFFRSPSEPGRGDGGALIEDSHFRNYVGIAVATAYTNPDAAGFIKKAVVRSSRFEPLTVSTPFRYPPAAISMNYGMSVGDLRPRDPLDVIDFNMISGNNFRVQYSSGLELQSSSCKIVRSDIGGFVCNTAIGASR